MRPKYHLTPPSGWLNDPNGLLYHNGEYHLFYQWCPTMDVDTKSMHWAHAVSRDLSHWQHLEIALAPDALGAIWSGSAVFDRHNTSGFFGSSGGMVAIFTHHLNGIERQSLAYSTDDGRTWTKYVGNPVLGNSDSRDFRDPKVFWHEPTRRWIMIVGWRQRLFASRNLREWEFLSETGFSSECPDLFPLPVEGSRETKWIISLGGRQISIGDFDGTRFTPQFGPYEVDGAQDFYASQSWEGVPDGRRIWIGWQNDWRYAKVLPHFGARGAMSLPRELSLRAASHGGYSLVQRPAPEIHGLMQKKVALAGPSGTGQRLFAGDTYELRATFSPQAEDRCGFKVCCSPGGETLIGYDAITRTAFVDRERSGDKLLRGRYTAPLPLRKNFVELCALVDRTNIEVFFNDGAAVFTVLILPRNESTGVEWFSENGKSGLEGVEARTMNDE